MPLRKSDVKTSYVLTVITSDRQICLSMSFLFSYNGDKVPPVEFENYIAEAFYLCHPVLRLYSGIAVKLSQKGISTAVESSIEKKKGFAFCIVSCLDSFPIAFDRQVGDLSLKFGCYHNVFVPDYFKWDKYL